MTIMTMTAIMAATTNAGWQYSHPFDTDQNTMHETLPAPYGDGKATAKTTTTRKHPLCINLNGRTTSDAGPCRKPYTSVNDDLASHRGERTRAYRLGKETGTAWKPSKRMTANTVRLAVVPMTLKERWDADGKKGYLD